ncbi:hypothetical protein ACIFQM_16550 [Paenibacillus sp. NRS-1782]|uniref:hypothetical protein n=1 Tax=unclassified Paenibacillus TaxID=185978 RepID=UPI003D2D463E
MTLENIKKGIKYFLIILSAFLGTWTVSALIAFYIFKKYESIPESTVERIRYIFNDQDEVNRILLSKSFIIGYKIGIVAVLCIVVLVILKKMNLNNLVEKLFSFTLMIVGTFNIGACLVGLVVLATIHFAEGFSILFWRCLAVEAFLIWLMFAFKRLRIWE